MTTWDNTLANDAESIVRPAFFGWLAGLALPLLVSIFTINHGWSAHSILRLILIAALIPTTSTLLYGYYLGGMWLWNDLAKRSIIWGSVVLLISFDVAFNLLSPSNSGADDLAVIGIVWVIIPVVLAVTLLLAIGAVIGAFAPSFRVFNPDGKKWTVRIQLIPTRKGIGIRERFISRWTKRRKNSEIYREKRTGWADALFNIPDGIDGLELLLVFIAIALIFTFVGWPLLLILADFIWLIVVMLGAIMSFVVLRRPVTIVATSKQESYEWKIRGIWKARYLEYDILHGLANGKIIRPDLAQRCELSDKP